jgi:tetrapyrrole methylase family protein/MazG family protein
MDELIQLVETLRGKQGCPWDKKQTPRSVSVYLIEEVFELVDAVETENAEQIQEELGDVLFHIVFMACMFRERGEFDLSDVVQTIVEKMIRRHPHVFDNQTIRSSEEVIENWHQIKLKEKQSQSQASPLDSVPAKLPALMRAYRILDRAAKSGCDRVHVGGGGYDLDKEMEELKAALNGNDINLLSNNFGELLFSLVNLARLADIHPETALTGAIKRFEDRFKHMHVARPGRK